MTAKLIKIINMSGELRAIVQLRLKRKIWHLSIPQIGQLTVPFSHKSSR